MFTNRTSSILVLMLLMEGTYVIAQKITIFISVDKLLFYIYPYTHLLGNGIISVKRNILIAVICPVLQDINIIP